MKSQCKKKKPNLKAKKIISYRKACKAQGTGLSHYVLTGPNGK